MKKKPSNKNGNMGLVEHLAELRKRLVKCAIILIVSFFMCFNFSHIVVEVLVEIAISHGYEIIYIAPTELFMQYVKIALIGGISISAPFIAYQLWRFIKPGLTKREGKLISRSLFCGFVCFAFGVIFSYVTIFPFTSSFFININKSQLITANISIANYITFVLTSLITFGIIFEVPVVLSMLTSLGLINPEMLVKSRKIIIVAIFVVSAIITPPDVISQMIIAGPMILIFEISITISKFIYKSKKKYELKIAS